MNRIGSYIYGALLANFQRDVPICGCLLYYLIYSLYSTLGVLKYKSQVDHTLRTSLLRSIGSVILRVILLAFGSMPAEGEKKTYSVHLVNLEVLELTNRGIYIPANLRKSEIHVGTTLTHPSPGVVPRPHH